MNAERLGPLSEGALQGALDCAARARVGVLGDLCLDMYWLCDLKRSELSRETPHFPLPVVEERASPGGAGNVLSNVAALTGRAPVALGVLGEDWRGGLLREALTRAGVDASQLVQGPGVVTPTYIKPLRRGISQVVYEDPRLDFANYQELPEALEARLLSQLDAVAGQLDALCVSDQLLMGCVTPRVRERVLALSRAGLTVVVDSRDRVGLYRDVVVKPNEVEAMRALGRPVEDSEQPEAMAQAALELSAQCGRPALVTWGDKGCLLAEGGAVCLLPGCPVPPPIDIVGAGDTFLSAFASALGGGCPARDAARLANLASSVTVAKVGTTGTASPAEIRAAWARQIAAE